MELPEALKRAIRDGVAQGLERRKVPVPLTQKYGSGTVRTAYRCDRCDQIVWWYEGDGPIGNQGCWCVDPRDEDKPERFVVVYHLPPDTE